MNTGILCIIIPSNNLNYNSLKIRLLVLISELKVFDNEHFLFGVEQGFKYVCNCANKAFSHSVLHTIGIHKQFSFYYICV